jgi:hypothetical protein
MRGICFTIGFHHRFTIMFYHFSPAFHQILFYLASSTVHLVVLAKRDPHAGDKRKLAKSHKPKELPFEHPEAHEGKTITPQKLQEGAAEILRREADKLVKLVKGGSTPSAGDAKVVVSTAKPFLNLNSFPSMN